MNKILTAFFVYLLAIGMTVACEARTFYVSAGATNGDGSITQPFGTLEEAQTAARAVTGKENVEIIVKDGIYRLSQSFTLTQVDSGTENAPVVYRAENRHGAHLTTAIKLDSVQWKTVTDADILARLPENARGKVWEFDLSAVGVKMPAKPGVHSRTPLMVPELFADGTRMKMARWPNEGWATVAEIIDGGSKANSGLASDAAKMNEKPEPPRGGTFEFSDDAPKRWKAENGVWLLGYWCFDWHDDVLQVATIDAEKKQITLAGQSTYGLRQGNPSPRRWCALHLLEELDIPGEYYVDTERGKLYFYPEKELAETQMTLSFRNMPTVSVQGASYVTLDGFTVEECFSDGISCHNAKFLTIQNCVIRNTRNTGVFCMEGNNNQFLGNLIQYNGTGGLHIYSGDRKTLTAGNCLVENNIIHDFAEHRLTYANGLLLAGVGHIARHNELYNAPHQAIAIGGNNMLLEYNIIHHVCLTGDDAAACYKGRDPSKRGNVIRWNYWHDIGSPRGHGNAAIYFDDGDGGEMVYGNIFVNCGDPGKGSFGTIFCHGGHGNFAENNIFVDCKRPLGSAPWNDKRWKDYIDAPLWQKRLLEDVDIRSDVYLKAYPELKGFMEGAPIAERQNFAKKNVFVNPTMEPSGTWQVDDSNLILDHDPGFVNAAEGNWELKADSEIFENIPGFQVIPFSKMGVQK